MLSNGNDLRIVYGRYQIDRDIVSMNTNSTQVWFKTQAEIGVSGSEMNYYAYYGYSGAGNPPSNRNNVYVFWDNFDDGDISDWEPMVGTWLASNDQSVSGSYSMKVTDTGIDTWIKPRASIDEADLELEAYMRVAGGVEDWAICARVQAGTSMNRYDASSWAGTSWSIARILSGSWTYLSTGTPEATANVWYKVDLRIKGTRAQVLVNGSQLAPSFGWTDIGSDFSSGSIALAAWDIGTEAWFDNVRLRKYVELEPSLYLQQEELSYYVSGTIPTSLQATDSDYLVTRSSGTSTSQYFPANSNLLGSTRSISGSISGLQANDLGYLSFRSYITQTSTTSFSNAFINYRSTTSLGVNYPKNRTWNGTTWSSENETAMWAGSPVRWVRSAFCPRVERSTERILVTLGDDGYLDAYVWDGPNADWYVVNDLAFSGISANAYSCYDVAYEKTTGKALLVYSRGTTTNEIGYRIWDGVSWGSEQLLNLPYTTGVVRRIDMTSNPTTGSNEIALIYVDSNTDVHGYVWTGSSWSLMGQTAVWDATAAISTEECIAVSYEQISGKAMFIWGDSMATDNYYRIWNGSSLGSATLLDIATQGAVTNWVTLKSDPASNGLLYLVVDGASNLNTEVSFLFARKLK
jgi:hypothetical protein